MIVLLPTIQHTGSHFLYEHLLANDFERMSVHDEPRDGGMVFTHISKWKWLKHWQHLMPHYPAIIPFREPWKVCYSWLRRREKLTNLHEDLSYLVDHFDGFNPYYLPIDRPDRQAYLDRINDGLGLNLQTDWPVFGSRGEMPEGAKEHTLNNPEVNRVLTDYGEFFRRFGYD